MNNPTNATYLETMERKTDCFCVIGFIVVHVNPICAGEILSIVEGVIVAANDTLALSSKEGMVTVCTVACKKRKISLELF